jgi:hypothetical protein
MSQINDPRLPKQPPVAFTDPRPEPNRDVLAARRRYLRTTFGPTPPKPHAARAKHAPRAAAAASIPEDPSLASAGYRYTKALPVLNDQLGYGEQIVETFLKENDDGTLALFTRTSQRTRTGRQVLFTDPPTDDDTAETEGHQGAAKPRGAEVAKQRAAASGVKAKRGQGKKPQAPKVKAKAKAKAKAAQTKATQAKVGKSAAKPKPKKPRPKTKRAS